MNIPVLNTHKKLSIFRPHKYNIPSPFEKGRMRGFYLKSLPLPSLFQRGRMNTYK